MIIKGNPAGSVKFWSKHLLRDDTNERAEVKEISGLLAGDLPSALREMQAIAAQSRSHGNFMYQANINPRDDEHLMAEQWKEAVDTLEKNLGLEGHQRVVVEHVKNGRQHYHVVWNRVDVDTLRVADMGGNWPIHEKTARELEARFGLTPTPTPTNTPEKKPALELYEIRAAERSGIDPAALKAELTELWRTADSGKAFASAIEDRGYILAKGDRRDFCIIDGAGDAHSLARRLDGVRAKDVRERMADVDRDSLPSVEEARETQRERNRARDAQQAEPVRTPETRPTPEAPKQQTAPSHTDDGPLRAVEKEVFKDERRERIEAAVEASVVRWEAKAEAERARIDPIDLKGAGTKTAALMVGVGDEAAVSLLDFVGRLLGGGKPPPQEFSTAASIQQLIAQRKALAAIENIRESMERGENLHPSAIQSLTPSHLENIRLRGDDYLRNLIEGLQRDRAHEIDYGRARER